MNNKNILRYILAIAIIITYFNALNNNFIWEDKNLIGKNILLQSFSNITTLFKPNNINFTDTFLEDSYRPLRNLSFMIDYQIWKLNPVGYHLTNILLHTINTLLIFYILNHLLEINISVSFIASLLFAIHPVNVHTVTYIKNRSDLIMLLFFLSAVIVFFRYYDTKRFRYYLFSLLASYFAILSKEMAITLPIIILGISYYKRYDIKKSMLLLIPHTIIVLSVVFLNKFYIYQFQLSTIDELAVTTGTMKYTLFGENILTRLLTQTDIIRKYIQLFIVPYNLVTDYYFYVSRHITIPLLLYIVCSISIIITGFISFYRRHILGLGILWFFIAIIPVSNIFMPLARMISENYMYLPSIGFFIIFGLVIYIVYNNLNIKKRKYFVGILIVYLCFLSIRTIIRNNDYQNDLSLWEKNVSDCPGPRALFNLGNVYLKQNRKELFFKYLIRSVEIEPFYSIGVKQLLGVYNKDKNYDDAISFLNKQLSIVPTGLQSDINELLGDFYVKKTQYITALKKYLVAVTADTQNVSAANKYIRLNLSIGVKKKKFIHDAETFFHRMHQYNNKIFNNWFLYAGDYYSAQEEVPSAIQYYKKYLASNDSDTITLLKTARLLTNIRQFNSALTLLKKVLVIDPHNNTALEFTGDLLASTRHYTDAIKNYYKIKSNNAIYIKTAQIFYIQKKYDNALNDIEKYLDYSKNDIKGIFLKNDILFEQKKYFASYNILIKILLRDDISDSNKKKAFKRLKKISRQDSEKISKKLLSITNPDIFTIERIALLQLIFTKKTNIQCIENLYTQYQDLLKKKYSNQILFIAKLYEYLMNYTVSELYYKKAVDIYPLVLPVNLEYARLLIKINQIETAKYYYRTCISIEPNNYLLYAGLGGLCEKSENYKQAEKYYLKSLELKKSNPIMFYKLGNIYTKQHRNYFAYDYYNKATIYNPDYIEAYYAKAILLIIFENEKKAKSIFNFIINHFDKTNTLVKKSKQKLEQLDY